MIVVALPWQAVEATLASLGPLDGRILLDAANPLAGDLSVIVPEAGSGAEQVAQWARGARVVKAFNTIGAALFGDSDFDMLYCGDDKDAKYAVRGLIGDTTMSPVDTWCRLAAAKHRSLSAQCTAALYARRKCLPSGPHSAGLRWRVASTLTQSTRRCIC